MLWNWFRRGHTFSWVAGCPALLAAVPAACPNFQALITALGSNLDPTQAQLGEAALTNPPDQDCCSAYRGFYSADDGKKVGIAHSQLVLCRPLPWQVAA